MTPGNCAHGGDLQPHRSHGLTHPRWPLIVTVVAILFMLPSLHVGLEADDYFHRVWLKNIAEFPELTGPPWDLFAFSYGDAQRVERVMDRGVAPWWTLPDLKMAFCRPLSSLTHWLDYALWPETPALMHAQNLFWFALLIYGVAILYRQVQGTGWVAGLAALIYALDDAHATPAGWIGGRNTLIAAAFGVWCIVAHCRWRREGWRPGAVCGSLLLLGALLSAEAGVATMAYLVSYALFLDLGYPSRRILSMLPYVILVIGWRIAWMLLGYGVYGVGAYVDPVSSPLLFLAASFEVGPILLMGQWGLPPSDFYTLYDVYWPGTARWAWLAAVAFLGLLGTLLAMRLPRTRETGFWCCGMVLALPPICATADFPMDRLLLFVGIGACGLLAAYLGSVLCDRRAIRAGASRPRWWVLHLLMAFFLVGLHLIASPIMLVARAAAPAGPHELTDQFYLSLPDAAFGAADTLVVVNAPSGGMVGMFPVMQAAFNRKIPKRVRMLGPSLSAMTITRLDEHTLRIRPDDGFLAWSYDRLVRGLDHPFSKGQRIELEGMTVTVTALMSDGRPAEALFAFEQSLEDPQLKWFRWRNGAFEPFQPPAPGESMWIPRTRPLLPFLN